MRKIDPQLCYRLLYPTIPVIVTSKFRNIVTAMPAVSYMMVSNNPVAYIETKLIKRLEVGDHVLLLSKVITCFAIEDFENYWKFKKYKPLLYIGMQNGARFYDQVKVR